MFSFENFTLTLFSYNFLYSDIEGMKGGELQFLKHSKEKAKQLLETGKFCKTDLEAASYEKNGYCIAVQGRIFFLLFCLLKKSTTCIKMEKVGRF